MGVTREWYYAELCGVVLRLGIATDVYPAEIRNISRHGVHEIVLGYPLAPLSKGRTFPDLALRLDPSFYNF
jgi:hypothetical protein